MRLSSSIILLSVLGLLSFSRGSRVQQSLRAAKVFAQQTLTVLDDVPEADPVGPFAYLALRDPVNAPTHLEAAVSGITADYAQSVDDALVNAQTAINDTFGAQVQAVADYFSAATEVNDQVYSDLSNIVFSVQQTLIASFK